MEKPVEAMKSAQQVADTRAARSRKQLGLFIAGSAFVLLSSLVTRRAIVRRTKSIRPPFFHPSNEQPLIKFNGPLEAVDALGVATINVFSYAILIGGGFFWAFDISTTSELKERVKMKKIDVPETELPVDHQDDDMVATWPAAALVLREEQSKHRTKEKVGTQPLQAVKEATSGRLPESDKREGRWRSIWTFR